MPCCCSLLGMFTALAVAIIHFLIILILLFISMSICFSCAFEFLTYTSNLLLLIFLLFLIPIIIMKLILDISTTPLLLNTPFPCDFHWIIECSQFRHQVCIEFLNILDINRIITVVLFVFGDSTCSRPLEVKLLLRWLGILCRVKVNILRIRRRGILIGA